MGKTGADHEPGDSFCSVRDVRRDWEGDGTTVVGAQAHATASKKGNPSLNNQRQRFSPCASEPLGWNSVRAPWLTFANVV